MSRQVEGCGDVRSVCECSACMWVSAVYDDGGPPARSGPNMGSFLVEEGVKRVRWCSPASCIVMGDEDEA